MRTHLTYLSGYLLLFIVIWAGYRTIHKQADTIIRQDGNITALRADTTEKAYTITVTRSQAQKQFGERYHELNAYEKSQGAKVREVHTIKYLAGSVVRDTVVRIEYPEMMPMQFYFPHGCVSSIVDYDPENGIAQDSLFGEIVINRYVMASKPRFRILKPWYWNSKNWPVTETRVENNCGLTIKENTILQLK